MDFEKATDIELSDEAQTGLRGQGAVVEMMRRLKDSIIEQVRSTNRLNMALLWFTIAIFVLAAVQFYFQFFRK